MNVTSLKTVAKKNSHFKASRRKMELHHPSDTCCSLHRIFFPGKMHQTWFKDNKHQDIMCIVAPWWEIRQRPGKNADGSLILNSKQTYNAEIKRKQWTMKRLVGRRSFSFGVGFSIHNVNFQACPFPDKDNKVILKVYQPLSLKVFAFFTKSCTSLVHRSLIATSCQWSFRENNLCLTNLSWRSSEIWRLENLICMFYDGWNQAPTTWGGRTKISWCKIPNIKQVRA